MLIEHSFVTTLPAEQAMAAASTLLAEHGFESDLATAFELGQGVEPVGWNRLQMRRGKKSGRTVRDPTQCPQRLLLEWDRGRVSAAASIEPRVARRSFSLSASTALRKPSRKQAKAYIALMTAIVESIERLLVDRVTPEEAAQGWDQLEVELQAKSASARRKTGIILAIVFLTFLAIAVLLIVFSAAR